MRIPQRRADQKDREKFDPCLSRDKFEALKNELERLKNKQRPALALEVKRLAEMGDFSENAGYQLAKGRLRGLNNRILEIEARLRYAEIIEPNKNLNQVQLGSQVTLEKNGQRTNYFLMGSLETDPSRGIISHNSPLGAALLGKTIGEEIIINRLNGKSKYKIVALLN